MGGRLFSVDEAQYYIFVRQGSMDSPLLPGNSDQIAILPYPSLGQDYQGVHKVSKGIVV